MTIRVLLFAQLADLVGSRELSLDLPDGARVRDAMDRLMDEIPSICAFDGRLATAIDERYANPDSPLSDGQTLALIPPVSGG